jgi:Ca2+-binding RTX toxin-like protein
LGMRFLESLEERRLFAGLTVAGGVIKFVGTARIDSFNIQVLPGTNRAFVVTSINGTAGNLGGTPSQREVRLSGITKIQVTLGNAADSVIIDTGKFRIPITLSGGGGNDNVGIVAKGNCRLDGGAGNDVLASGSGNDFIRGGPGHDGLGSADGDDTLIGDAGHDTLQGDAGNDLIDGRDNGPDSWDGGTGTDSAKADFGADYDGVNLTQEDFLEINELEALL